MSFDGGKPRLPLHRLKRSVMYERHCAHCDVTQPEAVARRNRGTRTPTAHLQAGNMRNAPALRRRTGSNETAISLGQNGNELGTASRKEVPAAGGVAKTAATGTASSTRDAAIPKGRRTLSLCYGEGGGGIKSPFQLSLFARGPCRWTVYYQVQMPY